jgi:DNA repair protein RadA/Sms
MVGPVGKGRVVYGCSGCGQQLARWAGRCPGCGSWGSIAEQRASVARGGHGSADVVRPLPLLELGASEATERRVATGIAGVDRVLGGGLVPASVVLLAGEPGIGKSTLLLQLVSRLSTAGLACLVASGEESRDQVGRRAARLGVGGEALRFVPGRDLGDVLDAAAAEAPFLLAVDSIQTIRDADSSTAPGGPAQVRGCADALVGLAKSAGITILLTGHVTKDGDLAGPRTLEHAVDVVLSFDGDARSGLRTLVAGKNRFGQEGEVAWFEMGPRGLDEIDPGSRLAPGGGEAGAATALSLAGRRGLAVEVQALAVPTDGPPRRQVSGLDARRFSLIAAVLERATGLPLSRCEVYGAAAGGMRLDDPGADLATAAAMASAFTLRHPPQGSAFVGEISLTGQVRPVAGAAQRMAAAAGRGIDAVYAPAGSGAVAQAGGPRLVEVRTVRDALSWCWAGSPRAARFRAARGTGRAGEVVPKAG